MHRRSQIVGYTIFMHQRVERAAISFLLATCLHPRAAQIVDWLLQRPDAVPARHIVLYSACIERPAPRRSMYFLCVVNMKDQLHTHNTTLHNTTLHYTTLHYIHLQHRQHYALSPTAHPHHVKPPSPYLRLTTHYTPPPCSPIPSILDTLVTLRYQHLSEPWKLS